MKLLYCDISDYVVYNWPLSTNEVHCLQLTFVNELSVFAWTGSSNETDFSSGTLEGGAAPGSSAWGLIFNVGCTKEKKNDNFRDNLWFIKSTVNWHVLYNSIQTLTMRYGM